jgi:hypothetical protein
MIQRETLRNSRSSLWKAKRTSMSLHCIQGANGRSARFNPAMGLVVSHIDDGHVSKTLGSDYPTQWFHVSAGHRVRLKRFISRVVGE